MSPPPFFPGNYDSVPCLNGARNFLCPNFIIQLLPDIRDDIIDKTLVVYTTSDTNAGNQKYYMEGMNRKRTRGKAQGVRKENTKAQIKRYPVAINQ